VRITYSGEYTALDAGTVQAYLAALRDAHGLVPVGAPVVRQGAGGPVVALLFEQGMVTLRRRDERLLITLEADGEPDRRTLETLAVQTFGLRNYIVLADTINL